MSENNKNQETKVFEGEFKGNKMFEIHKVDEDGKQVEKYSSVISFGLTKAKAILKHVEELKAFVEANDKK